MSHNCKTNFLGTTMSVVNDGDLENTPEENVQMVFEDTENSVETTYDETNTLRNDRVVQQLKEPLHEVTRENIEHREVINYADVKIQRNRYQILDKIRINCVNLAGYHNHRYHLYKNILFTLFRVPLILLNGINSFFSVGLQEYLAQTHVSLINAVISLFCGILTSVELLLNLQKRMELEQESSKEYYKLSVGIYTELSRAHQDRGDKGDLEKFLGEKYTEYQTLYSRSNAVNMGERGFDDEFELYIDDDENDDHPYTESNASVQNVSEPAHRHSIADNTSSNMCPVCCRNLLWSCLTTLFFCCTSSENLTTPGHIELSQEHRQKMKSKRIRKKSQLLSFNQV